MLKHIILLSIAILLISACQNNSVNESSEPAISTEVETIPVPETNPNYICSQKSDCVLFWNDYSKENPCPACDLDNNNWVCMPNSEMRSILLKIAAEQIPTGTCQPCHGLTAENYECECTDELCKKIKK